MITIDSRNDESQACPSRQQFHGPSGPVGRSEVVVVCRVGDRSVRNCKSSNPTVLCTQHECRLIFHYTAFHPSEMILRTLSFKQVLAYISLTWLLKGCASFSTVNHPVLHRSTITKTNFILNESSSSVSSSLYRRRNFIKAFIFLNLGLIQIQTSQILPVYGEDDDLTRGGVKLNAFNSLTFNYRGTNNQGLDGKTLTEPSISYREFLDALDRGEVERVELYAPNGDVCYAIIKKENDTTTTRIRIGDGFPTEDNSGWSSPSFVIKVRLKRDLVYVFIYTNSKR